MFYAVISWVVKTVRFGGQGDGGVILNNLNFVALDFFAASANRERRFLRA